MVLLHLWHVTSLPRVLLSQTVFLPRLRASLLLSGLLIHRCAEGDRDMKKPLLLEGRIYA